MAYHVSGAETGGTGFMATPSGDASLKYGSHKRMPDGNYVLNFNKECLWEQPGINWTASGLSGRDRGIRYHPGKNSAWTEGCFVFLTSNAKWKMSESVKRSKSFDTLMGATGFYEYTPEGRTKARLGASFSSSKINYTAYVRSRNPYDWLSRYGVHRKNVLR